MQLDTQMREEMLKRAVMPTMTAAIVLLGAVLQLSRGSGDADGKKGGDGVTRSTAAAQ